MKTANLYPLLHDSMVPLNLAVWLNPVGVRDSRLGKQHADVDFFLDMPTFTSIRLYATMRPMTRGMVAGAIRIMAAIDTTIMKTWLMSSTTTWSGLLARG